MRGSLALFITLSALAALPAFSADRVALVIGNDAYANAMPLEAAVSDARAMATVLRRLDFDVVSVSDASLEGMVEAMDTFKTKAAGAEAALVYYAGHGIESQGGNFLIPVDARLEKEIQLQTQAVNLNSVLEKLTALNVPARMVILDCCRNNPFEGRTWMRTRAVGSGGLGDLQVQTLPAATLVVYAASPGKPALDRVDAGDAHSPFTQALLDTLPEPGVHSFEVFGRVEEAVLNRTEGRQSPRLFYNGSTLPFRNFRFSQAAVPAPAVASAPAARVEPAPAASPPAVVRMDESPPAARVEEPAAPAAPIVLPPRGFFDSTELFSNSAYAGYNDFSRAEILRRVQQELKSKGHYKGAPDGMPGPGTQQALNEWQRAAGLPATGHLDNVHLQSLGLSGLPAMQKPPAATPQRTTPRRPAPALTPEDRVRRAVGI